MDTTNIKMTGGDFNLKDLSDEFDREAVTNAILEECLVRGEGRKQWLMFAIDMKHADHIAEWLIRRGKKTIVVHSKMEEYGLAHEPLLVYLLIHQASLCLCSQESCVSACLLRIQE